MIFKEKSPPDLMLSESSAEAKIARGIKLNNKFLLVVI